MRGQGPFLIPRVSRDPDAQSEPVAKQSNSYGYGPGLVAMPLGTDKPSAPGIPYDVAANLPPMNVPGPAPDESAHLYRRPLVD